jgi:hypothetical protein
MKSFLDAVKGASSALAAIAGAALCFLMLLTIADVVLRILGRPIVGTYELVGLGGAIAMGSPSRSPPGCGGTSTSTPSWRGCRACPARS